MKAGDEVEIMWTEVQETHRSVTVTAREIAKVLEIKVSEVPDRIDNLSTDEEGLLADAFHDASDITQEEDKVIENMELSDLS